MQALIFPEKMDHEDKARLIIDFFHRTMMHHALWFAEVQKQLGHKQALEIMESAWTNSYNTQVKRLSKVLGFEMTDGLPSPLSGLPDDKLSELLKAFALNWLAGDGTWFQAVEFSKGMTDAKICNDNCWAQFSPFEAWSIKKLLGLSDMPGLEGLKQALKYRLYAYINKQSISDETADSFIFRMNDCRVQSARKLKGLQDYPCKSAGLVEFPEFAKAVDERIKTECIGCPPDAHPDEWYCAWRFVI